MGGQEVIVTLGDRRNSGFCLMCGTDLIRPWNDYQCCSECTKKIEWAIAETERKNRAKKGKVGGQMVVDRRRILRQVAPIGKPVK